jgi:hypothetical protein
LKNCRKIGIALCITLSFMTPVQARADIFGGDVAVLVQILANALQQLAQLQQILGTGSDTLGLMRDINRGLRDGLTVIHMVDPHFNPGIYGDLNSTERVLDAIQSVYGRVPQTGEARLQTSQDQSVAETIAMTGDLFRVADAADQESKRIFDHSQDVSPQGAAKLTAQSIAVLINVSTQVLRTNSMMLKLMGQNMALQNKREKLQSAHFKTEYDGISSAIGNLPSDTNIQPLNTGGQ